MTQSFSIGKRTYGLNRSILISANLRFLSNVTLMYVERTMSLIFAYWRKKPEITKTKLRYD